MRVCVCVQDREKKITIDQIFMRWGDKKVQGLFTETHTNPDLSLLALPYTLFSVSQYLSLVLIN